MKKMFLFFCLLFLMDNIYINAYDFKKKSDARLEKFYLALSGIIMENNGESHTELNPEELDDEGLKNAKYIINRDWGIYDHKTSIKWLEWLLNEGQTEKMKNLLDFVRKINISEDEIDSSNFTDIEKRRLKFIKKFYSYFNDKEMLYAWDYGRVVSVSRWCYQAGYLTEDETWDYILKAGKKILALFNSWEDYGANYILGRLFWKAGFEDYKWMEYQSATYYYTLMDKDIGAWSKSPWPKSRPGKKQYEYIEKYHDVIMFYIAIKKNDVDAIEKIIKNNEEYYKISMDYNEWPPVFASIVNGSNAVTKYLISAGFDQNAENPHDDRTPLMSALYHNNSEIANFLIDNKVELNVTDNDKWTPLIYALRYSTPEIIKRLLLNGAIVDVVNSDGWTPLMFAVRYSTPEIIRLILEKKPDINAKKNDGSNSLILALHYSTPEIIKFILEKNPEINITTDEGWTPLMYALRYSTPEIANIILDKGAEVNIENDNSWTPLIFAIRYSTNEVVEKILDAGAKLDVKTNYDWTPLHFAAYKENLIISKKLIKLGLDINELNSDGKTPYDLIKRESFKKDWNDMIKNME